MSLVIGCMLCGAGGGKELALAIGAVFAFMMLGSLAVLAGSIASGDFAATETRTRPLEGEAEAVAAFAARKAADRG